MADAPLGYKLNYPIETPEAVKFWKSRHKCNRAKAICAFSLDEENALRNFTRHGYTHMWAKRAVESFGMYCAQPDMTGIPFSEMSEKTGDCMPIGGGSVTPPVETAPTVTILTTPKPVQVGDSIVIAAKVTGSPSPTISWKVSVNGVEAPISDTDDSISYTVAEAGTLIFTCTATNKLGSDSDTITYTASEIPKPVITLQPKDVTVDDGDIATFTADATDYDSVQWQYSPDGTSWSDIHSETSTTLTETATMMINGFKVRAVFTNAGGSVETNSATLTVVPVVVNPPVITLQPKDITVMEGETATFTTDGTGQNSIKWLLDKAGAVTEIAGETGKSYSFTTDIGNDGNKYAAQYINSGGITQTDWATLTVTPKPVLADIELIRPANGDKFRSGKTYKGSFKVNKPGFIPDNALPKYRLADGSVHEVNLDDTSVVDEGNSTYGFYFSDGWWDPQNTDVTFYVEAIGSGKDKVLSTEATIQWSNSAPKPLIPPYITKHPTDATVDEGTDVTFSADADNSDSVKWQVSTNGTDWNDISGATGKDYTFTPTSSDNGKQYKAIFTNANGNSETNPATLTVNAVTPTTPFSADIENLTHTDGKVSNDDEFKVTYEPGLLNGKPFIIDSHSHAVLMRFRGAGWYGASAQVAYDEASGGFPNLTPNVDLGNEGDIVLMKVRIYEGGNVGGVEPLTARQYEGPQHRYTFTEVTPNAWDDSATWNDNINW